MAKVGKITLKEGVSQKSGKPWAGLLLEAGTWSTLYFPQSQFEMDYLKGYFNEPDTAEEVTEKAKEAEEKGKKGLFN